MANGHTRMFLKQLLADPGHTGAIAPSSSQLAKQIVEFAQPRSSAIIVEFGPGTGVFTQEILSALTPGQRFFAIEVNPDFVAALNREYPGLHVHLGCASDLPDFCRKEGVDHVDCVISGLPWANFPEGLQAKILDNMLEVMPEGAIFVTFAYLQSLIMPSGKNFKHNLQQRFSKVETSGIIWMNLPPALIYRCVK